MILGQTRTESSRTRFAYWLMRRCYRLVERIDRAAVPKVLPWAFTFETGVGVMINDTGTSTARRGCMMLYADDREYERAHTDAINK